MLFHERLKQLRIETGSRQTEFSERLGIESSKYNKWENGKSKPDFDTVCMLAKHFGVPADYLMGISDIRNPENKALISELGLSEKAIEKLKSLGRIRVHENSEHDQRTLINVLNDMMAYALFFEDLLKTVGLASSQENFVEQEKLYEAARRDPGNLKAYPIAEMQFFKYAKDAESNLHGIAHELFEKEEELFYGPDSQ